MLEEIIGDPLYSRILETVVEGCKAPAKWCQPIYFKSQSLCLKQEKGGPCGLFAALQAYILYRINESPDLNSTQILIESILDMMETVRPCYIFITSINHKNRIFKYVATNDRNEAKDYLRVSKWYSLHDAAFLLIASIAMLLGPVWFRQYAMHDPFILEDDNTNITFVLLCLSGEALDNFHDGTAIAGGLVIKGALKKQKFGILSNNSQNRFQKVGTFFKNPENPIWVLYYGMHFTALTLVNDTFLEFDPLSSDLWKIVDVDHPFYNIARSCIQSKQEIEIID